MLVGADVTHPSHDENTPSIAAVSIIIKYLCEYTCINGNIINLGYCKL